MSTTEKPTTLWERIRSALRLVPGPGHKSRRRQLDTERVLQMYRCFREILANNDATLQLISDIEVRLSGQTPLSFNIMAQRIQKAVMNVFVMIRNLDILHPTQPHQPTFDAIRAGAKS